MNLKTRSLFQNFISVFFTFLLLSCGSSKVKEPSYAAYLFAYFTGNGPGEEAVRYAISKDGYTYYALNDNQPIIPTAAISKTGGVRDPHILRGKDGKTFYMVVTDLLSKNGWTNEAMTLLKSTDLVNWTSSIINIPETYNNFSTVYRVWAPQTIYDEKTDKYMIYFSMLEKGSYDKIYYAYANADFTALEDAPKQLFFSPNEKACIDGDIIAKDGKYHLFYKTEGENDKGIKVAISDQLTSGYVSKAGNVDQTDSPVEGSGVFKRIDSDTYILMYDMYMSGKYQFTESNDLENFKVIDQQVSFNFNPRHGTVIPITQAETARLLKEFPSADIPSIISASAAAIKKNNIIIDADQNLVTLPVKSGTDLSTLAPEFVANFSSEITPNGAQNFETGPVTYTLNYEGIEKKYSVSAEVQNNPVLEGYYADPEILYSNKNKKFYIYPTSDGFDDWSGNYFKTFSSKNLVDWTDEGVILDLPKDVNWTDRNAWAPTIVEQKIDGKYQYFYYYTGAQQIGVAVADDPAGPFIDKGSPLMSKLPQGINNGQVIDPDVFTDPQSGKTFLYWGNGFLAVAELNADMISLKEGTTKLITPDHTFREGAEVFFKDGTYYFLWSENDTRDPDYGVRYATSTSPTGPLTIPINNQVITKNESEKIFGTGHNSVLHVPETDDWYIVYHRFTRPKGITMGRSAGFHREVCIDKLAFDETGAIIQVIPTVKGINPI